MQSIVKRLSRRHGTTGRLTSCFRMRGRWLATLAVAGALVVPQAAHAFGPLDQDMRISFMGPDGNASYEAYDTRVAYNPAANEYLVVWAGEDNTPPLIDNEFEIFAQRVAAGGAPLGGRIRVSDMGPDGDTRYVAGEPSVAYNPAANAYLVTWAGDDDTPPLVDNEREIFGQQLTAAGVEVGANDFRISDLGPDGNVGYTAGSPSVAYGAAANEYLVTWEGDDNTAPLVDDEFEIFGQRLTAAGAGAGANDFRISDMGPDGNKSYEAFHASVAYNPADNQYLVIWNGDDNTAPLVNNEFEIFGQRLTAAGAGAGANDFRISDMGPDGTTSYEAYDASVAYGAAANEYLVAWEGDDDTAPLVDNEFEIFGQRLTAAGGGAGANDFRISDMGPNGNTSYAAFETSVAYSSAANEYLVSWAGDDDTAPLVNNEFEIFGQRLTAAGAGAGANDFRISDMGPDGGVAYSAGSPSGAYNSAANEYLVAWEGDDDTAPVIDNELEIFGRRLGEPTLPGGGPTPGGAGTPGGGTPDTVAPRFLSLTLKPTAFAAFPSGPSVRGARARGTRVSYRLSEAATATFRVQRALAGRRVRGRCVRPTRANRGKPRCTRYRTLRGSFSHTGTPGLNRFRFSGRLAGRKLRPGHYRLVAVAEDAAANKSEPVRRLFRIIR